MALDPFSGVATAQQIVTLAERRANNPGLHLCPTGIEPDGTTGETIMDAPAYAELQMILDQLCLTENFTFTRTAIDFAIDARINDLPALNNGANIGYWRIGFSDPAWIVSNADSTERSRVLFLDQEAFHARFEDAITGRPTVAFINRANGTIIVDPAPDVAYTMEIHCYPWQAALALPSSRPWFPFSEYLVEALLCKLYMAKDDSRQQAAAQNRDMLMKKIKRSLGDERDHASARLTLDPLFYRRPMEL